MTDSFKWIKSHLERLSYKWPARTKALNAARRKSTLTDKRVKWEYQCNHCKNWFKRKEVQNDHIVPKGRYDKEVFFIWLERLFCEADGFQVLCKPCHLVKSNREKNDGSYL
jgi:5-methylcytosine-specific restriction endonuclease McrA